MREAKPALGTLDHLGGERRVQSRQSMRVSASEQRFVGSGQGSKSEENVASLVWKLLDSAPDGVRQASGNWKGFPCLDRGRVLEDELADLERKKRVAAGHGVDLVELRLPQRA